MTEPRYVIGQRVRIADRTPEVHHRVPAYAKGRTGVIERICGCHGRPERYVRGDGRPMARLYRVRIPQRSLWPDYAGGKTDQLEIEIFEHWLEAAE